MKIKLSVVTFNLRMDNRLDGVNYFFNRAPFILDTINERRPDIICFQEATPRILSWLRANLYEYTVVGTGRGIDLSDEANPIAFRKDRFELFALDQFWLSPTPHKPGSRYMEQSPCPRICMTAVLRQKQGSELFRVYNTHLDHISEKARKLGMNSILSKIQSDNEAYETPVLLTGDMNALPDEACIRTAIQYGLCDLTDGVAQSFHNFGKIKEGEKIDYIFANCRCVSVRTEVWTMQQKNLWLSDHYPILCEVELE